MKFELDEPITQQSGERLQLRLGLLCLKPTECARMFKHGIPDLQALFTIQKNERAWRTRVSRASIAVVIFAETLLDIVGIVVLRRSAAHSCP